MLSRVAFYLLGVFLGEVMLVGWWGMQQAKPTGFREYFSQKWAQALFSGAFALAGTAASAEGFFMRIAVKKFPSLFVDWDLNVLLTGGVSMLSGAFFCFFAHTIVWLIMRKRGVSESSGMPPLPPPPPAGA